MRAWRRRVYKPKPGCGRRPDGTPETIGAARPGRTPVEARAVVGVLWRRHPRANCCVNVFECIRRRCLLGAARFGHRPGSGTGLLRTPLLRPINRHAGLSAVSARRRLPGRSPAAGHDQGRPPRIRHCRPTPRRAAQRPLGPAGGCRCAPLRRRVDGVAQSFVSAGRVQQNAPPTAGLVVVFALNRIALSCYQPATGGRMHRHANDSRANRTCRRGQYIG